MTNELLNASMAESIGNDFVSADDASLIPQIDFQIRSRPNAVALEIGGKRLTYAELNEKASKLASFLATAGIQADDVVAICLRRSEHLVIAILGVLKAGAAYLPLNPDDPSARLARIISHATPRFVVTDAHGSKNLPGSTPNLLQLDEAFARERDEPFATPVPTGSDLAYVIYTSGTTGIPKGVAVSHGALANIVNDVATLIGFDSSGVWLSVAPASFDLSVMDLMLPLSRGGRVILASEQQARMGSLLNNLFRRTGPTVMFATPINWRILVESGWSGSPNFTVLSAGDRMDRQLADALLVRAAAVWNMYGPTETTIVSTGDRVRPGEDPVPIGFPLANQSIYILDEDRKPVPTGEIGEIWIGGQGLARGYLNDLPLTLRAFVEVSVGGNTAMRLYRSGDLGRWNEQGNLECLGRIDHQVKIDGYRIELGEIESALRKHDGVAEAAALGVDDGNDRKRLYGVIVPRTPGTITKSALVKHLTQHIPKYMIPERFWLLDRLPTTSNGKRDLAILKSWTQTQPDLAV